VADRIKRVLNSSRHKQIHATFWSVGNLCVLITDDSAEEYNRIINRPNIIHIQMFPILSVKNKQQTIREIRWIELTFIS
jgi:hypothetical protein